VVCEFRSRWRKMNVRGGVGSDGFAVGRKSNTCRLRTAAVLAAVRSCSLFIRLIRHRRSFCHKFLIRRGLAFTVTQKRMGLQKRMCCEILTTILLARARLND
jgi:hypothetical protein